MGVPKIRQKSCTKNPPILLEGANGPIALLDVEGFPVHHKWHLAYRKGKELSMVAKSYVDFLHQEGERLSTQVDELADKIDPRLYRN